MSTIEIDFLTADYYKAISFKSGETPDFTQFDMLFYEHGLLVNNNFSKPVTFNTTSFIETITSQVAAGETDQFMMREVHSKTELFGTVANRVSVYEFSITDNEVHRLARGINFMQFIKVEGTWRILSVAWCDENENNLIPSDWLI